MISFGFLLVVVVVLAGFGATCALIYLVAVWKDEDERHSDDSSLGPAFDFDGGWRKGTRW